MTYPLNALFTDPLGRWGQYAPFDGTEASDAAKGFISTQEHVDIRAFRKASVPGLTGTDEGWALGGSGLQTLTVGPVAGYGGWSALQCTTTGAAVAATLTSSLTKQLDISAMDIVSLIFPDYNSFDGTSTIQFTSKADGSFGTASYNSAAIAFSSNTSVMPQLRFNVSSLSSGAGVNFSLAKITGVKITLGKAVAPAANQTVTVMGLRAAKNAWTESALDFDTFNGVICVPPTLTGSAYAGTVAKTFEFIRGDGTKNDPIPADLAFNVYFYPGGSTSPNDATGSNFNRISVLLREQKDSGAGTGSHIEVSLLWNDSQTKFDAKRVDTTGGSPGTPTSHGDFATIVGSNLDPAKFYVFNVQIRGTTIDANVYESTGAGHVGTLHWQLPGTLTDSNYTYRNGRIGFCAALLSRDAFVAEIDPAATGYAELISETYASRTPVNGVRLAAVYAQDLNLFTGLTGPDLYIDPTKTISGNGSYRSAKSLTTNGFLIEDWTQTYLAFQIWVPSSVTLTNQPEVVLNTPTSTETLALSKLLPSQWNPIYFDLTLFRDLITSTAYSFTIQAAGSPDKPLGYFWLDSIMIGRRRVAWSARATANGPWREFKNLTNDPHGAIHFNPIERGSSLEIKADALTEDAWVSSFQAFPHYAELGLPLYDQAFETR